MKKYIFFGVILLGGTLFTQQIIHAAISTAECKAKGTGSYCSNSWGGDGCYDQEKVVDQCTVAPGSAPEVCCVPYTTLCQKLGGRVTNGSGGPAGTCNAGDTIPYQWGNQKCCVGAATTPAPNPGGATPNPNPGGGTPNPSPGGGTPDPNPGGGATPTPNPGSGPNNIQINFKSPTEYTTVETFLDGVLGFARNIVVILALVFLVIGAILYITSGGNDKRIGAAKSAITAALIGLAIVMVAPAFLKELAGVLGWSDLPSQASDALSLTQIATNVLNFLLSVIGIIAIIMFLIGGMMYLTSAGDEKRAETGKGIVKAAIIGIIVAFSALVIVKQIATFF